MRIALTFLPLLVESTPREGSTFSFTIPSASIAATAGFDKWKPDA